MAPAGYIDDATRQKIERAAAKATKAVHERDVAIMEAVDAGISLRTLGRVLGMSHSAVRDIAGKKRDELAGREPRRGRYPAGGISDPSEWPEV